MPKKGYKQTKEHKKRKGKRYAKVLFICPECGTSKYVTRARAGTIKFCSSNCARKNHKDDCACSFCKAKRGEIHIAGKNHYKWKGREYQGKDGRWYVWIDNIKYRRHRYIAIQCLHRELTSKEEVHHINEDCSDDRPENLYIFSTKGEHTAHHHFKNPPILISNLIN